ncbi:hypothetical protein V3F56_07035 [Moorellaceae bacterium AZ2]
MREGRTTARRMLVLGVVLAAVGLLAHQPLYSAGVVAALPVSLGFYMWLVRSVEGAEGLTPGEAQNVFLRRALIRMGLFLALLLLAAVGGPSFLLGVLSGLLLQMLSYLVEAFFLVWRKA